MKKQILLILFLSSVGTWYGCKTKSCDFVISDTPSVYYHIDSLSKSKVTYYDTLKFIDENGYIYSYIGRPTDTSYEEQEISRDECGINYVGLEVYTKLYSNSDVERISNIFFTMGLLDNKDSVDIEVIYSMFYSNPPYNSYSNVYKIKAHQIGQGLAKIYVDPVNPNDSNVLYYSISNGIERIVAQGKSLDRLP